jgi:LEA14-like dessication related protein
MRPLTLLRLMLLVLVVAPVGRLSAQTGYDRKSSRNPHGSLNIPCENCHTNTSWKPIRGIPEFDHSRTQYPLRGMHEKVACKLCHTNLVFSSISTRCSDCHADIHRGQFGAKCEDCHTVKGWENHTQQIKQHDNRFPLLGAHALAECADCHKNEAVGQFAGLATSCISCHTTDFQNATGPDHKSSGFPITCESCHTADTWFGAKFDHLKFTGFALTGAHATLECTACHIGGKFKGTPADCYGCHAKDFIATKDPNHVQAGFPQQCQLCHTTTSWLGATFDHNKLTKFPLTGAHVNVPCASCHINGQYAGTPMDCYSCHAKDFKATTNPNHVQAAFPQQCQLCHTTATWQNATFDHNLYTKFPLTGAHVNVPCNACHINGQYAGTPTDCYSCHAKDYKGTTDPNHVQAAFPTDCSMCHSTVSWANATFNHNNTPFPLTGAHVNVPCSSCHINGKYAGTPTDCYSCHAKDYKGTTDPNHVQAAFPTDCSICHSTSTWAGATFNHNSTPFPLTGAHVNVPCASCHINGKYAGTPTDCYSCHTKDYTGTTNPNHASAGFPTDCSICHTTASWAGATFNHNNTPFPLTGAHVNVPCASCHIGNVYAGTPTDCYSCHKADYTGTTNPNHAAAGFPTSCQTCHTTTSWLGATFNHTYFPVNHGNANGVCSTCHTNPNDFSVFTCTNCHTKSQTDPKHSGVSGYVYNSVNCYQCHKNGGGG